MAECDDEEFILHLFMICSMFSVVWTSILWWLRMSCVLHNDVEGYSLPFFGLRNGGRDISFELNSIWLICVWYLRKTRSSIIFRHDAYNVFLIVEKMHLIS